MRAERQLAGVFSHAGTAVCPRRSSIRLNLLIFSWAICVCAANGFAGGIHDNMDTRWQRWIGSWRLVSDTVNQGAGSEKSGLLIEIRPGSGKDSIIMKSCQDEKVLLEEEIMADGSRHPLADGKCPGWYRYSWSDNGKRLLFESQSGCSGESARIISGLSLMTGGREWMDIQLLKLDDRRSISIRKYELVAAGSRSADEDPAANIGTSRFQEDQGFSIDEIIELNREVDPEVLGAALVELNQPFAINSRTLRRMADSGIPPKLVDLMVALSYPDKFNVLSNGIDPVRISASRDLGMEIDQPYVWLPFGYWSIYGPFSDWYWSPAFYRHYSYWWSDWNVWWGGNGNGRDRRGGRLVNGRGYSRPNPPSSGSQPRYAHPRVEYQNGHGKPSGSRKDSASRTSSSSSSTESSQSGRSSSSQASPSGYHGSGGRGAAKPRD